MSVREVAVLFARRDSYYKRIAGCDVWDAVRDARRYDGAGPIIAHPPCRAWGRLKAFAIPADGEKDLGLLAVDLVRRNGGVLEHPAGSTLWRAKGLPRPVQGCDAFGGYTIHINQCDFGHRAQKATWLYIVNCPLEVLPRPKIELGIPDRTVTQLGRAAREHTPPKLAEWLVELARCTDRGQLNRRKKHLAPHGQVNPGLAGQVEPGIYLDPPGQLSLFD